MEFGYRETLYALTDAGRRRLDQEADAWDDESLSLAVPVLDPNGTAVAALEWSGSTDASEAAIRKKYLPEVQRVRRRIETMLVEVPRLGRLAGAVDVRGLACVRRVQPQPLLPELIVSIGFRAPVDRPSIRVYGRPA